MQHLNFKSGQFTSLKTNEAKWKLAFCVLFPDVAEAEIPSPCTGISSIHMRLIANLYADGQPVETPIDLQRLGQNFKTRVFTKYGQHLMCIMPNAYEEWDTMFDESVKASRSPFQQDIATPASSEDISKIAAQHLTACQPSCIASATLQAASGYLPTPDITPTVKTDDWFPPPDNASVLQSDDSLTAAWKSLEIPSIDARPNLFDEIPSAGSSIYDEQQSQTTPPYVTNATQSFDRPRVLDATLLDAEYTSSPPKTSCKDKSMQCDEADLLAYSVPSFASATHGNFDPSISVDESLFNFRNSPLYTNSQPGDRTGLLIEEDFVMKREDDDLSSVTASTEDLVPLSQRSKETWTDSTLGLPDYGEAVRKFSRGSVDMAIEVSGEECRLS